MSQRDLVKEGKIVVNIFCHYATEYQSSRRCFTSGFSVVMKAFVMQLRWSKLAKFCQPIMHAVFFLGNA